MKFLVDSLPVILFFIVFKVKGIYMATGVAIASMAVMVAFSWIRYRKVDTMLWIGLAVITVFGGSTILLHNELFIKWKPTVLYWIFAGAIFVGQWAMSKNVMRVLLEKKISLPDDVWTRLNLWWGAFFLALGGINLAVAYTVSTAAWVNFKLFGVMGLMMVFVIAQAAMLSPHIKEVPGPEKQ